MVKYHLKTPIKEEDVRKLQLRDVLYITGEIFTSRDLAHHKALKNENYHKLYNILKEKPLFHCGPLVDQKKGKYRVISSGPTTSMRMENFEYEFINKFQTRIIIGKGGMGATTLQMMKKVGTVYCSVTGGTGALIAKAIKSVKNVKWINMGMVEALWIFNVENFGPLIVTMDSNGNSLYQWVKERVEHNLKQINIHINND